MRNNRFTIHPKYILIFFLIICLLLIVTSYKFKENYSPIRAMVGDVVSPMQRGINGVGTFFTKKTELFTSKKALLKENKKLQSALDHANYENKILQQDKDELASLRKLYDLNEKYSDYNMVAARVIDKDPGNWYNVFIIDKGSKDGLKVDMNVLAGDGTGGGLVGIITEVGHNWAKVRGIIDDTSNVGAMISKSTCVVSGNLSLSDQGLLAFSDMEKPKEKLKIGDAVVTSYLSEKYHQGILIGYVKEVKEDKTNGICSGYITPTVNFDQLETVLIITQLKEKLEPEPDNN
ncbi:MAG: rod shape-determining protein MreC [Lachnospiraceae bacterium]|nr:rod shape-determining protein MreC [Lachnospiraceae bacterium]